MVSKKEIFLAEMILAEKDKKAFYVLVSSPELPKTELILNLPPNVPSKRWYYKTAYNENLELISNTSITITGYKAITSLRDLPSEYRLASTWQPLTFPKGE